MLYPQRVSVVVTVKDGSLSVTRRQSSGEASACGEIAIDLPKLEFSADLLSLRDARLAAQIFEQRFPRLDPAILSRQIVAQRFAPQTSKVAFWAQQPTPSFGPTPEPKLTEYEYNSVDISCDGIALAASDVASAARNRLTTGDMAKDLIIGVLKSLYP